VKLVSFKQGFVCDFTTNADSFLVQPITCWERSVLTKNSIRMPRPEGRGSLLASASYAMVVVRRMGNSQVWSFLTAFILAVAVCQFAFAETEGPMVIVFHLEDCPDCARMEAVLEEMLTTYPSLSIAYYEANEPSASALLEKLSDAYRVLFVDYPLIFVEEDAISGAGRAKELRLRRAIEDCARANCSSPLARAKEKLICRHQLVLLGTGIALFLLLALVLGD